MRRENQGEDVCEGKERLPTMERARRIAKKMNSAYHANAEGYHCRRCNGFHVGTSPVGRPERRRAKPRRDEELA